MVESDNLPPLGNNVQIQSPTEHGFSMNLWAFCWRMVSGGMVLRFLDPSEEFLKHIDRLPNQEPKPEVPVSSQPHSELPECLNDPKALSMIDLDQVVLHFEKWIINTDETPSQITEIIRSLTENDRVLFQHSEHASLVLVRMICFSRLLSAQVQGFSGRKD